MVESNALAEVVQTAPANLFGATSPNGVLKRATDIANALAPVLEGDANRKAMVTSIGQGRHINVEGWVTLGNMVGVFPQVEWTKPIRDADGTIVGYEARCRATTIHGNVVGAGESMCMRDEDNWDMRKDRRGNLSRVPDFALRSMAQTRATSKALSMPLRFIVQLAGFETTPAEEMEGIEARGSGPVRSTERTKAKGKKKVTKEEKPKATDVNPEDVPNEPFKAKILRTAKNSGTTNNREWTRFGILIKDEAAGIEFWLNTFNSELAEAAEYAKENGVKAMIKAEHTERGVNLLDLDVLEGEEV